MTVAVDVVCRVVGSTGKDRRDSRWYTDDVQGLQRLLTDLETALDTVTSRHPASVVLVPWREVATMEREVHEDSARAAVTV